MRLEVLTKDGLAYYHNKIKNTFVKQSDLDTAIDNKLDTIDWVTEIGDAYVTPEQVSDIISQSDLDNYLPLSGGTLSGHLQFSASEGRIQSGRADNDGFISLYGGGGYTAGAYLQAYGKSHATYPGMFRLFARDDTNGVKELRGTPAGVLTWGGNNIALAKDVLALSGGTMTGNISNRIDAKRGTAPASPIYTHPYQIIDNDGNRVGSIYSTYTTNKTNSLSLLVYTGLSTDNTFGQLGIGFDANGDLYTIAPTPATSSNNTNIATTAYVKSNLSSYLPLSGGTMTGNLAISGSSLINVGSTLHDEGRGGWIAATGSGIRVASEQSGIGSSGAYIDLNGRSYAAAPGHFMITANSSAGSKTLIGKPDGTLVWGGNDIAIESKAKTATNTSNLGSSTSFTTKASLSLSAGTWLVCANVEFPTNATGVRALSITSGLTNSLAGQTNPAIAGSATSISASCIVASSGTTNVHAMVFQDSGSTLKSVKTTITAQKLSNYTSLGS